MDKISRKGFIYYLEDSEMKKNNDKNDIVVNFGEIDKINNPLLLKIIIKIEKNGKESYKTQFLLNGEEYKSYNEIYETINSIYENIESIQRNAFSQKKYISFIYGKQFRLFLDYFLNKKMSEDLNYYLCYFTNKDKIDFNNFIYKNQQLNIKTDFLLHFYQNFIDQCEHFLDEILKKNELSLENIYQQNKICEEYKEYNEIYLNGSDNLENEIIYFYKYFTKNTPLASTLLLCQRDTSSEEIISFLYRAIRCKYHIFFLPS